MNIHTLNCLTVLLAHPQLCHGPFLLLWGEAWEQGYGWVANSKAYLWHHWVDLVVLHVVEQPHERQHVLVRVQLILLHLFLRQQIGHLLRQCSGRRVTLHKLIQEKNIILFFFRQCAVCNFTGLRKPHE